MGLGDDRLGVELAQGSVAMSSSEYTVVEARDVCMISSRSPSTGPAEASKTLSSGSCRAEEPTVASTVVASSMVPRRVREGGSRGPWPPPGSKLRYFFSWQIKVL